MLLQKRESRTGGVMEWERVDLAQRIVEGTRSAALSLLTSLPGPWLLNPAAEPDLPAWSRLDLSSRARLSSASLARLASISALRRESPGVEDILGEVKGGLIGRPRGRRRVQGGPKRGTKGVPACFWRY